MDKYFVTGIDHCTIMNAKLQSSADVFFPLGFVGDGNCRALSQEVKESFVPSVRFVFDNAYLESAQFPPQLEEFYHFLKSDAGTHMTTLLTDNAERFRNELIARGDAIPEIVVTEREGADHGEKKGKAVFHLVEIPFCAIPDTHMAYLEHLTPELLYQPNRYAHPNTVFRFDEIVMCVNDLSLAEQIGAQMEELCGLANSASCPGGVRRLRIMDSDSFRQVFGCDANEDRCVFSAMVFSVKDLEECRKYVKESGFYWHETDGAIYVDVMDQISLVLVFRQG